MNNFKTNCEKLENEILEKDKDKNGIFPISDGVINHEEYLKSKFKILWILKEPHEKEKHEIAWSLCKEINKKNKWSDQPTKGRPTYKPMILASYGILNNFILFDTIPDIQNDNSVFNTVKKIAYINVKKYPNLNTNSDKTVIKNSFKENKNFLMKQIEIFEPDIIIGGSTLHLFHNELNIKSLKENKIGYMRYYTSAKNIYIEAYHPSVRSQNCKSDDYVNLIILAVKNWIENR